MTPLWAGLSDCAPHVLSRAGLLSGSRRGWLTASLASQLGCEGLNWASLPKLSFILQSLRVALPSCEEPEFFTSQLTPKGRQETSGNLHPWAPRPVHHYVHAFHWSSTVSGTAQTPWERMNAFLWLYSSTGTWERGTVCDHHVINPVDAQDKYF